MGWSTALTTCCAKVRLTALFELVKIYGGDGDSSGIPYRSSKKYGCTLINFKWTKIEE